MAIDVTGRLGVGEGLVGHNLLQAVQIVDFRGALGSSGVAKKSKDSVLNVEGVVQLESGVGGPEDSLVRVLLGDLALRELARIQRHLAGRSNAREGNKCSSVLHDVGIFVMMNRL